MWFLNTFRTTNKYLTLLLSLFISQYSWAETHIALCTGSYAGDGLRDPYTFNKDGWVASASINDSTGTIKWIVKNSSVQNGTFKIINRQEHFLEASCVQGCWDIGKNYRRLIISPDFSYISDIWQGKSSSQMLMFSCEVE